MRRLHPNPCRGGRRSGFGARLMRNIWIDRGRLGLLRLAKSDRDLTVGIRFDLGQRRKRHGRRRNRHGQRRQGGDGLRRRRGRAQQERSYEHDPSQSDDAKNDQQRKRTSGVDEIRSSVASSRPVPEARFHPGARETGLKFGRCSMVIAAPNAWSPSPATRFDQLASNVPSPNAARLRAPAIK